MRNLRAIPSRLDHAPLLAVGAMLIGLGAGCSNKPASYAEPARLPAETWDRCAPEETGIDSERLVDLMTDIAAGEYGLHSLLVVRHGCLVLDASFFPYDGVRPHDMASCTKSLVSLATGVALARGALASVDDTLAEHLKERSFDDPAKGAVTLEDLLTMRSGFECDADPTLLSSMQRAPDWIDFALGLPLASTPGTTWQYCSPPTHLLSGVISAATGLAADELLQREVFATIGAERPLWPRDPQGTSHGWGDARLRPRDLARLGLLLLREGKWGEEELLDGAWLEVATRNRVGDSGPQNGYGYLWWPTQNGYRAVGRGGQYLVISPSADLVVVATGAAGPSQLEAQSALETALAASLVADTPLPRNPSALAKLEALVSAAPEPPEPSSVSTLPAASAWASGQRFELEANSLGWTALTLSFEQDRAELRIELEGSEARAAVGLDGVPRVTRGIARLSANPRHDELDIALSGRWTDASTFELTFDTIDRIDAGTMRFELADGKLTTTVREQTELETDIVLLGTRD